jgi:hypothetical protein
VRQSCASANSLMFPARSPSSPGMRRVFGPRPSGPAGQDCHKARRAIVCVQSVMWGSCPIYCPARCVPGCRATWRQLTRWPRPRMPRTWSRTRAHGPHDAASLTRARAMGHHSRAHIPMICILRPLTQRDFPMALSQRFPLRRCHIRRKLATLTPGSGLPIKFGKVWVQRYAEVSTCGIRRSS